MSDTTRPPQGSQLEGVTKSDLARLEKILSEKITTSSQPSSPAESDSDDTVKRELEELATYRENERQKLLKKLPKTVIEEFKLNEKPLDEVKKISTLTQVIRKRSVGIDTPPTTETKKEKIFQWNPATQKNEWC